MSDPIDLHIGFHIRLRRLEQGMSQEQLAAALGLSFQQVQKYENGSNRCAPSKLVQIAQILKAPVASFFPPPEGVDTPEPASIRLDSHALALAREFETISSLAVRSALRKLVTALAEPPRAH